MRALATWLILALLVAGVGCSGTAPAAVQAPPPPVHAVTVKPQAVVPRAIATAEILANRQSNL
ncbi:MAG: hypothetical protein WBM48_09740, partial [Polyangiales bacterium]